MTVQEYTLPRSGRPNAVFEGELLISATSPKHRRHLQKTDARCHWFEMDVYKTTSGKYVVALRYRFSGKLYRETPHDCVFACTDAEEAIKTIRNVDPTQCVNGYPEGNEIWDEKQVQLMASIRDDYASLAESVWTKLESLSAVSERID